MTANYRVVWKGPVNRRSGLGIASREYVKALRRLGVHVAVGASGGGQPTGGHRVLVYHHAPSSINMRRERMYFDTIIMNTVWETTRIPRRWVRPINQADAVCVPSFQNKQALRNSGITIPIYIVPHGIHTMKFRPVKKKRPSRSNRFTFISVFGFQHRKNPEALLKAYWTEFSSRDNVRLIIKTNGYAAYESNRWINNRIATYKANLKLRKTTAPIQIITRHLNSKALRNLYAKGHAFVLPTRGEGVGLPFLESLASGVPVIATGWGGHRDFVTARNSFLVHYKLQPPVISMNRRSSISRQFRSLFAGSGQLWAEVSIKSLRRQMRKAYENPWLCVMKGRAGRRDVLKLTWNRGGLALKKAIETTINKKRGATFLFR